MAGWNNAPMRSITGREEYSTSAILAVPETPEEWEDEYERRRAVMYGEPYTLAEIIAYGIFRAVTISGDVDSPESLPLREADDERFVQAVNASALFRAGPQLELAGDTGDLSEAEAVWERSSVRQVAGYWASLLSGLGELGLEAVRFADGPRVVAYDPASVRVEYDTETSTRLVRVTIVAPYIDPDETDEHGRPAGPSAMHTYKRVLDAETVEVWVDGEYQPGMSGPHGVGRVPFEWLQWTPLAADPAHGVPSSHGMAARVARMDSLDAQVDAVGKRYANPHLAVFGAKMSDPDVLQLGKTWSGLPSGGRAEFIEPSMAGVRELREVRAAKHAALKESRVEYIFHGAGASASGEALKVRAAQFVSAVESVRARVFGALAAITEVAVGMGGSPQAGWLAVTAPPVLPVDRAAGVEALAKAAGLGLLAADVAMELQRLGFLDPRVDAADYGAAMEDQRRVQALEFMAP